MDPHSIIEISDRAREVFRQTVEAYLSSGAPVGSRTIARVSGLGLSPASIRNVMQDLEELGLLAAPHTSAGRMPTELGLRLFVDGMMQTTELSRSDQATIEEQVRRDGNRVEDVLARAVSVLSGLSSCAGIVLVPKSELVLRQISFVPLSPERALAVIVGADGMVENRVLELPPGLPTTVLVHAGNFINARLTGLTLAQAATRLREEIDGVRHELDELARTVVEKGLALWSSDGASRPVLLVRGQSHLLDEASAADLDRVRLLLEDLEGKEELVQLLDLARDGQGMKIFIGSENKLFSLSGSSVIAAPYRAAGGGLVGVVGVIGPTRLNYARVVPMVDYTAKALSRLIG
jgi:heat-inducible transcriptional repressor